MARSFWTRSTHAPVSREVGTWVTRRDGAVYANAYEQKERVLDAALDEYCALREAGRSVNASEFCRRYPSYQRSLRRLIDVHEAFGQLDGLDTEPWPERGGELLGFQIVDELGVGAFARVYLAQEPALGNRYVALKLTLYGGEEAETLGRLSHPNIVPIHSVQHEEETGITAVCMPYLGSSTLADILDFAYQAGGPPRRAAVILEAARAAENLHVLEADERIDTYLGRAGFVDGILHLGIQIADALDATHRKGILHRDLKPSNVLVTPGGRPMLLDFNLSCDAQREGDRLGGTLPYMPPEQIRAVCLDGPANPASPVEADPRSDIFSLGVVLYEALSGELPFGDPVSTPDSRAAGAMYLEAQKERPVPLEVRNPAVDPAVARIIDRCLSLEIAQRPVGAAELAAELRDRVSWKGRLVRWAARNRAVLVMVALLMLIGLSLWGWHLAVRPPFGVRMYRKALANLEAGRYGEALDQLEWARREYPDDPHIPFAEGVIRWRQEDYERMTHSMKRAMELTDEPLPAECYAYSSILKQNQLLSSARYYAFVFDHPKHTRARVNLSASLISDQPHDASLHATKAIIVNPYLPLAYEVRAAARLKASTKSHRDYQLDTAELTQWLEGGWRDVQIAMMQGRDNPHLRYLGARLLTMVVELDPSRKDEIGPVVASLLRSISPYVGYLMLRDEFRVFAKEPWYGQLWARSSQLGSAIHPREYLHAPIGNRVVDDYLRTFDPRASRQPAP